MTDPAASDPSRLLGLIGSLLDEAGIDWVVIGAMAVAYHGWVRLSLDANALISLKSSRIDLDQLADRLRAEGWLFAGGPKDLEDAEGILRVRAGSVDLALVSKLR